MNQNENETNIEVSVWIARDDNGLLCLFEKKPVKVAGVWWAKSSRFLIIHSNLFKDITSENEPCEAKLTLINNK